WPPATRDDAEFHQGRVDNERDDLLGDGKHALGHADLLRILPQPAASEVDDALPERRQAGAAGLCALPQGDQCPAARVGRAQRGWQGGALDRDAPRRALRGDGTTQVIGGRRADLFPKSPMIAIVGGGYVPNQRLKLTGAAILVLRASTSLPVAPA